MNVEPHRRDDYNNSPRPPVLLFLNQAFNLRMTRFLIIIIVACSTAVLRAGPPDWPCSRHSMFPMNDVPTHVRDSSLLLYDVNHYGISLEVNDTSTFISGYTDILATALGQMEELVFELSSSYQVDSVFQDGERLESFTHLADLVRITPRVPPVIGEKFTVRVYYHGEGGQNGFFAGISNRTDLAWGQRVTYTLSEPFLSLDWFVCKQVLPDKADSADVFLTVGDSLMAGSNGILAGVDSLPGGKLRYHWKTRYPVAYYLLSLAVSRYREYSFYADSEFLPDSLLIQNYIYDDPQYLEQNRDGIDATAALIDLYSRLFVPYPFFREKYGHCLAPIGGGMEHQTMTTLNGFSFTLVAHELTHQWFGDNVTCASWQDIWIHEGFASYGEYLALEALVSPEAAREWMGRAHEMALTEPEGSVYIPEEDAGDEYRIFSAALSYKKGAALLHMIRYELGNDSLFFRTLSEFQLRYADSVATGRDFMEVLNEISGSDFGWFFDQWYFGQGFPEFLFTWWQSADSLVVEIIQSGSSPGTPFFRTGLDLELQFESGGDTLVRIRCDSPLMTIRIPMEIPVAKLVPDPGNWVLQRSEVIRKIVSAGYLKVSPNPFGEELNIRFLAGAGDREIILSDLNGRILERHFSSSGSYTLHTGELVQGLYFLKVNEGKETYTTRVVRQ